MTISDSQTRTLLDYAGSDIYRERLAGVRCRLTLDEEFISLEQKALLGSEYSAQFRLTDIEPLYAVLRKRSRVASFGALSLGIMLILVGSTRYWSHEPAGTGNGGWILLWIGALALITGIWQLRATEYYVFKNRSGTDAFMIARAGPDHKRFDEFAARVVGQIEAANARRILQQSQASAPSP